MTDVVTTAFDTAGSSARRCWVTAPDVIWVSSARPVSPGAGMDEEPAALSGVDGETILGTLDTFASDASSFAVKGLSPPASNGASSSEAEALPVPVCSALGGCAGDDDAPGAEADGDRGGVGTVEAGGICGSVVAVVATADELGTGRVVRVAIDCGIAAGACGCVNVAAGGEVSEGVALVAASPGGLDSS